MNITYNNIIVAKVVYTKSEHAYQIILNSGHEAVLTSIKRPIGKNGDEI